METIHHLFGKNERRFLVGFFHCVFLAAPNGKFFAANTRKFIIAQKTILQRKDKIAIETFFEGLKKL